MVSCNISGAEVALLGRAGNFVALSSWPAAREPPAEPLERLEPENFRESAVRRGRRLKGPEPRQWRTCAAGWPTS